MPTPYLLHAPCMFLTDYDAILDRAAKVGRQEGRDDDWVPETLNAAFLELLLFEDCADDAGVVFFQSTAPVGATYRARIDLDLYNDAASIRKMAEDILPDGWLLTLDNALMTLLNSGVSPNDFFTDIAEDERPQSNHTRIDTRDVPARFKYTGRRHDGLFQSIFSTWPALPAE